MNVLMTLFFIVLVCVKSYGIKVPVEWPKEGTTVSENEFSFTIPYKKHTFSSPMEEIDLRSNQNEHGFRPIVGPMLSPPSTLKQFSKPYDGRQPRRNIKGKYMDYPNKKPKFYKNIEASSGLNPRKQSFRGLPVHPINNLHHNTLGQHRIQSTKNPFYSNVQEFVKKQEGLGQYLNPTHASYKIYHPYKAEKMQILNHKRDPLYKNIKDEVNLNAKRLKQYENDAGNVHINKDQYLKPPKQVESDIFNTNEQHENFPIEHEPYTAQKKPNYYQEPKKNLNHYHRLNNNLKYPIKNHDYIKVIPKAYDPLKQQLGYFRVQQHSKFNDEEDEYPSLQPSYYRNEEGPAPEGVDIYDTQKYSFDRTQNNFNNDFNNFADKHHPNSRIIGNNHSNNSPSDESSANDSDFVPVKMYAQVRKTNTIKHLPREAALEDAETFDEVLNAPRLKQAVKSAKSQVVYSEEGYEDSAYDHAGHQKHASNQEGHKGSLKQKESSAGKYKNDEGDVSYGDGEQSALGQILTKGKKDLMDDGNVAEHQDVEGYSNLHGEYENDEVLHPEEYDEDNNEAESEIKEQINSTISLGENLEKTLRKDSENILPRQDKTEDITIINVSKNNESNKVLGKNHSNSHSNPQTEDFKPKYEYGQVQASKNSHQITKRDTQFTVPTITLENTYLTNDEIETITQEKVIKSRKKTAEKYPYYKSTIIKSLSVNSPIRYAENLSQIPKKSRGGTEFYDSTSNIDCPDVETNLEPVPDHIKETLEKNDQENKEEYENAEKKTKREVNFKEEELPRLSGLGDKIDCFRQKFFGENPLDNPIFLEDTVGEPEPIYESFTIPTVMLKNPSLKENIYLDSKAKQIPKLISPRLTNIDNIYARQSHEKNSPSHFDRNDLRVRPSLVVENYRKPNSPYKYSNVQFIPKLKVSLPDVLNRYVISTDPQTKVYSDVMDNIRTMISSKNGKKSVGFPLYHQIYLNEDGGYISPTLSTYKAYTNKEHIDNPSKHIRIIRESPFAYDRYKIDNKTHVHGNIRVNNLKLKGDHQHSIKLLGSFTKNKNTLKTVDTDSQPVKRNAAEKVYMHIRRNNNNDTQNTLRPLEHQPIPKFKTEASADITENLHQNNSQSKLNNHKDIYTPITLKSSISAEDYLSGKYLNNTRQNNNKTSTKTSNLSNPIINQRKHSYRRPFSPIFDVSEYLPKINNYLSPTSRFNLSSKFNAGEAGALKSTHLRPKLDLVSNSNQFNVTVPNLSRKPNHTITQPQNNNTSLSFDRHNLTQISKYGDNESDVNDEWYDESKSTEEDSAEIFNDNEESINDDTIKNNQEQYYGDNEPETISNEEYTTIIPAVKQVNKEEAISNWKKVLELQHPSIEGSQENHEAAINKPRVVEKTSKKRKTTVITNSRIYKNDQKPSTEKQNKNDNLELNKKRVVNDHNVLKNNDRYSSLREKPIVINSNIHNVNDDNAEDEHIVVISKPNSRRNHSSRKPLKEIRRFEENVREEEIINEGTDSQEYDTTTENPGASTLAQDVNNLSKQHSSNRDQHSLHSDVEVFRSDFKRNSGPKHGGNYRSISPRNRKRRPNKEAIEREDSVEGERDILSRSLHSRNHKALENLRETPSARILSSLRSALPEMEKDTQPRYIKDPSQRMYYYVDT